MQQINLNYAVGVRGYARLSVLVAGLWLSACAPLPEAVAHQVEQTSPITTAQSEGTKLTADQMFRVLVAETLAVRGLLPQSAHLYLQTVDKYPQPSLAQRAYDIASRAGNRALLERATLLNMQLNPAFLESWQVQVILKLRENDVPAAASAWQAFYRHSQEKGISDKEIFLSTATLGHDGIAPETLVAFANQIADQQSSVYAEFMRVMLLSAADKPVEAMQRLLKVTQRYAEHAELAQLMASLLVKNPDPQGMDWLKTYWQTHSDEADIGEQLGRAYVVAQQLTLAKAQFAEVLRQHPQQASVRMSLALVELELKNASAAQVLLEVLVSDKRYADMARYYLGQALYAQDRLNEAVSLWSQVKQGEYRLDALIWRAQVLSKQQRWSEAERLLQEFEAADEAEQGRLIKAQVRLFMMQGKSKEALRVLDRGLFAQPDNDDLWQERANLKFDQGDSKGFEQDIRQAIRLNPHNADAMNALGYYLVDTQQALVEARQLIEQANSLLPNRHYITDSLGWLLYREGQLDLSEQTLAKAYRLKEDAEILRHWLTVLLALGRHEQAKSLLKSEYPRFADDEALRDFVKQKALMP